LPISTRRRPTTPDIGEIGLVLILLGLRLVEHRLIGPGIDFGQEVALLDQLAFGERNLVDLSVDTGADQHGVESLNGSKACQVNRKVRLLGDRHVHPDRVASCLLRPVSRCFLVFGMEALPAVISEPSGNQGQQNPTRCPRFVHCRLQI
jgi:hypothetical protein